MVAITMTTTGAFAQTSVRGFVGMNYPAAVDGGRSVYDDWRPGIIAGVKVASALGGHVSVEPGISYQLLFYDRDRNAVYPDDIPIEVRGDPSQVVQAGANILFLASESATVTPQLILGGGYQWITYGSVSTTWKDISGIYQGESTRTPKSTWFLEFGAGVVVKVSESFEIQGTLKSVNAMALFPDFLGDVENFDRNQNDWIMSVVGSYSIW
jgi:hypothetical protein